MISSVSVVIPVYNSAVILPHLLERLHPVLERESADYEIILVNDGSSDASWEAIAGQARTNPRVTGINLTKNYGQHNALLCGVRAARMEYILTMDDDLQHPPEEIPRLVEEIQKGWDVVYGAPEQECHGFFRDVASRLTKLLLQRAMGVEAGRNVSAFRIFRSRIRNAFAQFRGPHVSVDVLLSWGARDFHAIRVRHDARPFNASSYTLGKLVAHMFNMLTGFSTLPLQVASIVGFCMTLFGIFVFLYVAGRYLITGVSVPGFPFLASIISIFSGAQLFAIGVIGEYLARMHFRIMGRPTYAIRERVERDEHCLNANSSRGAHQSPRTYNG